jgi:hypothetical protein
MNKFLPLASAQNLVRKAALRTAGMTWSQCFLLCGFFLLAVLAAETRAAQGGPMVWVAPELARIGREDPATGSNKMALWAARGEYESFQVVVRAPASGLTNVRVSASALTGEGHRVIAKSNLQLFREYYVHVFQGSPDAGGSNRPLGPGWYADALIPFAAEDKKTSVHPATMQANPFDLAANTNQPIWIDVFVPRGSEAGAYLGTVTVASDQGAATVSVIFNVWNFELPLRPSLHTAFAIYNTAEKPRIFYGDSVANQRLLLEHKLMPAFVDPAAERQFIDELGLNLSQVDFFKVASYSNCQQPPPPSVADFSALKAKHQPDLPLYVHLGDEVTECRQTFPAFAAWAKNIRAAGFISMLTAVPVPELRDDGSGTHRSVADIWVMLPNQIVSNAADMNAAMKKGDQVWSYTALVQDSYSPKWAIDFAPVNYRILGGFLNQVQGLTGLLYWNVNSWVVNPTPDPWNNISYIENGKSTPPGEGWLVYPGEKVGSNDLVPSIRLKWIRKSVEDYEYVEILKRLGRGDWALGVARKVAPDWTNWTRDPNALETAHRQLGDEINRLMSTKPAGSASPH